MQSLKWEILCISVSLDGAPAMLGHVNSFSAFVIEKTPKKEVTHSMIQRHALMVKYLEPILEAVMHDIIKDCKFDQGTCNKHVAIS